MIKLIQTCQRCKHKWIYTGKKRPNKYIQYTGCPKCKTSVKLQL